jgi:hypothetical protein
MMKVQIKAILFFDTETEKNERPHFPLMRKYHIWGVIIPLGRTYAVEASDALGMFPTIYGASSCLWEGRSLPTLLVVDIISTTLLLDRQ